MKKMLIFNILFFAISICALILGIISLSKIHNNTNYVQNDSPQFERVIYVYSGDYGRSWEDKGFSEYYVKLDFYEMTIRIINSEGEITDKKCNRSSDDVILYAYR